MAEEECLVVEKNGLERRGRKYVKQKKNEGVVVGKQGGEERETSGKVAEERVFSCGEVWTRKGRGKAVGEAVDSRVFVGGEEMVR